MEFAEVKFPHHRINTIPKPMEAEVEPRLTRFVQVAFIGVAWLLIFGGCCFLFIHSTAASDETYSPTISETSFIAPLSHAMSSESAISSGVDVSISFN